MKDAASFMRRALALAARGAGRVHPNPLVGCVLVKGGKVVAEGWHKAFGGPHAEVEALRQAGSAARGATAYVTLEPCAHFGKTPPCADGLINSGVARVVAAMKDPNPLVNGKGLARLRKAGVAVEVGVLEADARALNVPFVTRMEKSRPYVILKAAVSLDGKMAAPKGRPRWITGLAARAEGHKLRAHTDAILVGIGTVLADDPHLTSHGKGRNPLRVVLDSRGRTPVRAKVRDGKAETLILTRKDAPHANGKLDLKAVLRRLADRGVGTLLVEGGAQVHRSFLKAGLADELRLFVAPKLIGGPEKSFFQGRIPLDSMQVSQIGPDLMITGKIRRKR